MNIVFVDTFYRRFYYTFNKYNFQQILQICHLRWHARLDPMYAAFTVPPSLVGSKPILRTATSFSALTLSVGSFDPQKPVPDMSYNVFSGTLNPTQSIFPACSVRRCRRYCSCCSIPIQFAVIYDGYCGELWFLTRGMFIYADLARDTRFTYDTAVLWWTRGAGMAHSVCGCTCGCGR